METVTETVPEKEPTLVVTEEKFRVEKPPETSILSGQCKGETEKALLIQFEGSKEIWVPKSTVRSNYDAKFTGTQNFEIDTWILKKNNILA